MVRGCVHTLPNFAVFNSNANQGTRAGPTCSPTRSPSWDIIIPAILSISASTHAHSPQARSVCWSAVPFLSSPPQAKMFSIWTLVDLNPVLKAALRTSPPHPQPRQPQLPAESQIPPAIEKSAPVMHSHQHSPNQPHTRSINHSPQSNKESSESASTNSPHPPPTPDQPPSPAESTTQYPSTC